MSLLLWEQKFGTQTNMRNQHVQVVRTGLKPHHAVPSQEVGDDLFVNVVHQTSWTLVVISGVNKELLTGVLINQGTDLMTPRVIREHERSDTL